MAETDPTASFDPELTLTVREGSGASASPPPERIGRYVVERVLGEGAYGLVYLARDEELQRSVAIKVPRARHLDRPEGVAAYLAEARAVASLDHPHIVPVYDVGSTAAFPCFVVSKYIDGTDLATRLKQVAVPWSEATAIVATVADALHHAHTHGLFHRDVKPGNLLLDRSGKPFVGDFGLALREQDVGRGPHFAGTAPYMSPEQARGEGHRVDGRSDLFSLGIVFYELLTGRRPFPGPTLPDYLDQITTTEPRPPRQINDTIPKELERICLKALAKRASDRYTTGRDMADDLLRFDPDASTVTRSLDEGPRPAGAELPAVTPDSHPVRVVPKGLRSFDAADADFFLELLPGPRDRDGLPDGVRFWKAWAEATDADRSRAVGLMYGPSGCGKSSLVMAGLLPRLAKSVRVVSVEATAEGTEARLLRELRRRVPALPETLDLPESLAAVRRGLLPGEKVLIVLDQFEQWMHSHQPDWQAELVRALRQCDGGRVQCLLLVRDDFWLAVSRFMQTVEVRVVDGENSRLVDLFDLLHARRVLAAFGRAYGRLPDAPGELSKEQEAFLDRSITGLAQDGKVVPVRLALFAQMVQGRPWTLATLRDVGGAEGVGVAFLDETFTASTAPPLHRVHRKAAQAFLAALLPESGSDIRGHMRSRQELREASGYALRPESFDELVSILDGEVRLITPTEPEQSDGVAVAAGDEGRYYQLTHDYLVRHPVLIFG